MYFSAEKARYFLTDIDGNAVWLLKAATNTPYKCETVNGTRVVKCGGVMADPQKLFSHLWAEQNENAPLPASCRSPPHTPPTAPPPAQSPVQPRADLSDSNPSLASPMPKSKAAEPGCHPDSPPPRASALRKEPVANDDDSNPSKRRRVTFEGPLTTSEAQQHDEATASQMQGVNMKPDELPEFSVGVTNEGLPFTAPKGVNGKADSMHPLARALHRSDSGGCDDWTIGRATVSRAQFVASASGKTKSMYVHNLLKFPSRVPLHPPTPSLALAEPPDSPSPQKPKPDVEMADTAAVEAEGHGKTAVEVPADDVSTGPAVPMQPSMPPSMGDIEAKFAEALAKQQLEFDRRFAEALAKQQEQQQQQPLQSSPDQGAEAAAAASAVASPAGQTAKQLADATAMQQQQPLQAPSATAAPSAEPTESSTVAPPAGQPADQTDKPAGATTEPLANAKASGAPSPPPPATGDAGNNATVEAGATAKAEANAMAAGAPAESQGSGQAKATPLTGPPALAPEVAALIEKNRAGALANAKSKAVEPAT